MMLPLENRPPERVPMVTSPGVVGTTFTTKLPPELISTDPETSLPRVPSAADRAGLVDCVVAVAKLTLQFDPDTQLSAVPKAEPDWLCGEFFKDDDPAGLLLYGGDFAPYKPRVDVTLTPPAMPLAAKELSLELGPLQRTAKSRRDFGPLHPLQPPRSEQLGTFDDDWLRDRWPYFPRDFNYNYFNGAPVRQRMEKLRGDEVLKLRGFHAQDVRTRLPGITLRAFAQYSRNVGYRFSEITLRLDTLHIDLTSNSLQLVWRGQLPVSSALAPELTHVYACSDRLASPIPLKLAREQFARRLEREAPEADEVESAVAGISRRFGISPPKQHAAREQKERSLRAQLPPPESPRSPRPQPPPAMSREQVEQLVQSGAALDNRDFTGCDLRDLDLSRRRLTGSILTAADLSGAVLEGASLKGAVLSHAKLIACDLRDCNLTESNLGSADLSRAELGGASLRYAELSRATLADAHLQGAILEGARLAEAILEGADLTGANLSQADLSQAHAARAIFRKAILRDTVAFELHAPQAIFDEAEATRLRAGESDLRGASLRGVEASGSNFEGSILEAACLDLATFDDATLAHGKLHGAKLRRFRARVASFRHADLSGADVRRADLMQSNFERADLRATDLRESNLFEVETLDAELAGVRLDQANTEGSKLSHPILGHKEHHT